ncbi:bifunctional 2-polyprenyl-6-hydroxyphenol methylase/3-demethylubiquinol 3-O-methyltransferase UbiG [Bacillus sp. 03113]|uniref:class I SAM-dependent methyltransferase n=1 Tax=Bacillus sp. 03113 TaxID=2578211 RepID=UPI0011430661|nr:class I SAM-dependent methyltransferase [Bacillus sp. 03113]
MENLLKEQFLDFNLLKKYTNKPELYAKGDSLFWNDPYISDRMLENHLNPETDGASRNKNEIEKTVEYLHKTMNLKFGSKLLDIGCGPGLYAQRFHELGYNVIGIDYSKRSINYAKDQALKNNQSIKYIYGDYTEVEFEKGLDAAVLIYGDYCVLTPENRKKLLQKVYDSLNSNGYFIFDVSTPTHRKKVRLQNSWYYSEGGFWKGSKHLVLEQGFNYDGDLHLDQFIVIEHDGTTSIYRNWFQDFTKKTILNEIETNTSFNVENIWSDLKGTPYDNSTDWIGIVCKK